jgi:hypothetical protein
MKKASSRRSEELWQWPPTEWSASGHIPKRSGRDPEALNELILRYQTPLKAYLLAAFPGLEDEAEELLQDFLEDKILKEGWLDKAEEKRGRFRDFLKISLKNFVRDRLRTAHPEVVSMSESGLDLPAEESGSGTLDLEWVRTVLGEALKRMELDCRRPRRNKTNRVLVWETFRLRLVQPILEGTEPVGYDELVSRLEIASPSAAQNLLVSAKRIFSRHLKAVIAEYEKDSEAAATELQELRESLDGLAHGKT